MTAERLAESTFPIRFLLHRRKQMKASAERHLAFVQTLEEALAIRTGHGPGKKYLCICGAHFPGYPTDQRTLLWRHIEEEWAKDD